MTLHEKRKLARKIHAGKFNKPYTFHYGANGSVESVTHNIAFAPINGTKEEWDAFQKAVKPRG